MMRLVTALLAAGIAGWAQEPKPVMVDAIVVDAAGQPVADLTAADFEVTSSAPTRSVQRLNLINNLLHTSAARTPVAAWELTPDQIRRTTVFVVDDLCMPLDSLKVVRRQLHEVLSAVLESGGQAAILRSSGGTARTRQLTKDTPQLASAIEAIEFLGGGISPAACAAAAWTTVAHAITGLQPHDGRKAVVLISGALPAPPGGSAAQIASLAAEAMTAVYQTAAEAPMLTQSTGGDAGIDLRRILQRESSYYVLSFTPAVEGDFRLELHRPGLTLRTRRQAIHLAAHSDFPVPHSSSDLVDHALNSPFDGQEIDVRLTPLFADLAQGGPIVELLLHLDIRELSTVRDAKGRYRMSLDVNFAGITYAGQAPRALARTYSLELPEEEYRRAREEGVNIAMPVSMPSPGMRQIRVVVADTVSSGMGSASAFVDVPDVRQGRFAVSGIVFEGGSIRRENPAVRVFRPGAKLKFSYSIYNASTDKARESQVETQTRIYAGGQTVFTGKPSVLTFPPGGDAKRRSVTSSIELDATAGAGHYVLHVIATDRLSGKAASAGQYIDFTIE